VNRGRVVFEKRVRGSNDAFTFASENSGRHCEKDYKGTRELHYWVLGRMVVVVVEQEVVE
jgi:hypothetical protein